MGALTLTVLGTDGSYPGPGGAGSGYLVQCAGSNVLLDAGPGTLSQLQQHISIEDITAVVISHEHVDHWSDLEHLAVACRYIVSRPPIRVYSESDPTALMRVGAATSALDWSPIGPESKLTVGAMRFSFSRTDHSVPTLAVRVDGDGRSLGYSADSGPGWGLASLGAGIGLALCEATHLADLEGTVSHMSARQAGACARQAGVDRLVLIHTWARVDRAAAQAEGSEAFGRPVEMAVVGRRYPA
jgi:ribonuclease BN (tRNA processing enzyme)